MAENVPEGLVYTKTHEWLKVEGKQVRIGITDHAQSELTDIVYVQLPKLGMSAAAGKVIAVLESVKTVADVFAPASGTIREVNEELTKNPELLNREPYGKGWIFVMETESLPKDLLTPAMYRSSLSLK